MVVKPGGNHPKGGAPACGGGHPSKGESPAVGGSPPNAAAQGACMAVAQGACAHRKRRRPAQETRPTLAMGPDKKLRARDLCGGCKLWSYGVLRNAPKASRTAENQFLIVAALLHNALSLAIKVKGDREAD